METFVGEIAVDPDIWTFAGVALIAILSALLLRIHAQEQEVSDPLSGLFDRSTFEEEVESVDRRIAKPDTDAEPRRAVLRGKVDHLAQVGQIWGQETRAQAIAHVAQVMRASMRGSDDVTEVTSEAEGQDDDGSFVILASGANEADAGHIAQRLIQTLAETQVGGIGYGMRLTASFGVAERRAGETDSAARRRADSALKAAQVAGEDQVVTATEWEEVKLLPSPAPTEVDAVCNPDKGGAQAA